MNRAGENQSGRIGSADRAFAAASPSSQRVVSPVPASIPLRVLVACEFSGVVRRAFRERGHDAWSCDLLPAEDGSEFHLQGDVRKWMKPIMGWELMICHPPCTHLAVSGARHFAAKRASGVQQQALAFVE